MYLYKLMFRSLLRHRERGRRLAVLIGLCTAAIVFLLAMMDSFSARYIKLFVDTTTAHLSIVHSDAAELKRKPWKRGPTGLLLIDADPGLVSFLESQPSVEAVAPAIRTMGQFSVLSGEEQGTTAMIGIDPGKLAQVYPGARVSEGEIRTLLEPNPATPDVPVLRRSVQFWETAKVASDKIALADLRVRGEDLRSFMDRVGVAFPSRFPRHAPMDKETFLAVLDSALGDPALYREIPTERREEYDWRLEEVIVDAQDLTGESTPQRIRNVNKQLFAALFPQALSPVSESIALHVPMTVVSTNLVDRSREIGTYYCLGASRGFLKRMYTLEILLVNLAGAATGILIGLGVALVLNGAGFRTDDVGLQMVLGGDRLHLAISVSSIALLLGGLIAVTALTALFTLGSALRVSPAAAMRDTQD